MRSAEFEGESPSPDSRPACPPALTCATLRPLDERTPTVCLWPTLFRRITTKTSQTALPLTHHAASHPAASNLPAFVRQADPGVFQLPSPSPSPVSSSYPPHQLGEARSTHALGPNPLSFDSNPIQSNPVQPKAQSCPVRDSESNPAQSKSTAEHSKDRNHLRANPPSALPCPRLLLAARPPCRPGTWDPEPLPHQTLQLSIASSIPLPTALPLLSAYLSVDYCLPYCHLQTCSPACLVYYHPVISRLSHQSPPALHWTAAAVLL